jgi:Pyruvate/2-oxoacid:ferredoxin oxidoreductase gamma subunit
MLGALVRATGLISFESVEAAIRQEVPEKIAPNVAAAREALERVVIAREAIHA